MKTIVKIIASLLFVTGIFLASSKGNYFPLPNFLGVAVFAYSIFVFKNIKRKEIN